MATPSFPGRHSMAISPQSAYRLRWENRRLSDRCHQSVRKRNRRSGPRLCSSADELPVGLESYGLGCYTNGHEA